MKRLKEAVPHSLDKNDSSVAGVYYNGDVLGCQLLLKLLKKFYPEYDPDNKQTLDHK